VRSLWIIKTSLVTSTPTKAAMLVLGLLFGGVNFRLCSRRGFTLTRASRFDATGAFTSFRRDQARDDGSFHGSTTCSPSVRMAWVVGVTIRRSSQPDWFNQIRQASGAAPNQSFANRVLPRLELLHGTSGRGFATRCRARLFQRSPLGCRAVSQPNNSRAWPTRQLFDFSYSKFNRAHAGYVSRKIVWSKPVCSLRTAAFSQGWCSRITVTFLLISSSSSSSFS